jgi:hypothetical protein
MTTTNHENKIQVLMVSMINDNLCLIKYDNYDMITHVSIELIPQDQVCTQL